MGRVFASLTSRLVLTTVALVLLVAVLIGAAATALLNRQLNHQIDDDLRRAGRATFVSGPGPVAPGPGQQQGDDDGGGEVDDTRGRGPQTVVAHFYADGQSDGTVVSFPPDNGQNLTSAQLAALSDVPVDGDIHEIELPDLGTYRVIARTDPDRGVVEVTGLPTAQADQAVTSLIGWEALLIVLGALVAAGGGLLLVRRQLRPLTEVAATAHRVAALPLAEGEIDLSDRVPC